METAQTTAGSQLNKGTLEGLTGNVTVSALMGVTGESREAVVKFFKTQESAGVGRFVIGRKGGESRFVVGEKVKPKRVRRSSVGRTAVTQSPYAGSIPAAARAYPQSTKRHTTSILATLEHLREEVNKAIERVKAFEDIVDEILG